MHTFIRAAFAERFGYACELSDPEITSCVESRSPFDNDYCESVLQAMLVWRYQRAADDIYRHVASVHFNTFSEIRIDITASTLRAMVGDTADQILSQPDLLGPDWSHTCAAAAQVRWAEARIND